MTHAELVKCAARWLRSSGCGIVLTELNTAAGEIPDAIGWSRGFSVLVECKASRADFCADIRKPEREFPETGMGDWRFYLSPPGVLLPADMPSGWGLLYAGAKVRRIHGEIPLRDLSPFAGDKRNEIIMLSSALRRLYLRGYLPLIYERPEVRAEPQQ